MVYDTGGRTSAYCHSPGDAASRFLSVNSVKQHNLSPLDAVLPFAVQSLQSEM
jgi:hypothetical protein